MQKNKKTNLKDLTKEELVEKCENQREQINISQNKIKQLTQELIIYKTNNSNISANNKVAIYMNETLSLISDIEYLKQENLELKKENEKLKENNNV